MSDPMAALVAEDLIQALGANQRASGTPCGHSGGRRFALEFFGGGEGTRTLDLRLAKPPLFQLSYTPGANESAGFFSVVGVTIVGRGDDGPRSGPPAARDLRRQRIFVHGRR